MAKMFTVGILLLFTVFLATELLSAQEREPDPRCGVHTIDEPFLNSVGGAGVWENARNKPGSLRFEVARLFSQGRDTLRRLKAPRIFCSPGCKVSSAPTFHLRSSPARFVASGEDARHCASLEAATRRKPIVYSNPTIKNLEELQGWISDLSTGRGQYGRDLYTRCDATCSPRYEYLIRGLSDDGGYSVSASVICGAARDKRDNTYILQTFFRWSCVKR